MTPVLGYHDVVGIGNSPIISLICFVSTFTLQGSLPKGSYMGSKSLFRLVSYSSPSYSSPMANNISSVNLLPNTPLSQEHWPVCLTKL